MQQQLCVSPIELIRKSKLFRRSALRYFCVSEHLLTTLQNLAQSKELADVTLVCDDNKKVEAHSFVLSACSDVFRGLLIENTHQHPMIYLRGIDHQDMESLMQFMYQGKATFYHERMKQFVEAAKSLQITEISTGLNLEDDGQETEDNPQEEMEPISDNSESVGESRNTEEMETINGTSNTETRVSNHGPRQPKTFVANSTNSNVCPECERIFGCSANMKRHYDSVHLGKRQTVANPTKSNVCPECEKIFGDSSNMKKHFERVHLQTKYPCNQCDAVLSDYSSRITHIKTIHEGVKVNCSVEGCERAFSNKKIMNEHIQSFHNGEKFPCTQCDYQAKWRGDLCKHMKSVHEGQQFQCTHCEYNIQSITERSTSDTHEVSP